MRHWHPALIERGITAVGLSFYGHHHTRHVYPVRGGAFVAAPITSCWDYDFIEKDCDGPDHYKAFVRGTKIGAYKVDPTSISPPRAKACAVTKDHRRYCVSDWRFDKETVCLDTHHRIEGHALVIGCPGPRLELPCKSKD
jgi:hypothetical protein